MNTDIEIPLEILEEYEKLIKCLTKWGDLYAKGKSPVEDIVYDTEYKKLKKIELEYPSIISSISPSQKVSSDNTDGFKKVLHSVPMISIANSNNLEDLKEWCIDKSNKGCKEKTIEFKMDGLAMALLYKDGMLYDAITRGDGKIGDSVYRNILEVPSIPKLIHFNKQIEIRGELVWLKEDFNAFNEYLKSIGKEPLSNPRNGEAGTIKSKNPQDIADRKLYFVAYNISAGSIFNTQSDDLIWLKKLGFNTSEFHICKDVSEILCYAESMKGERYSLPFNIDGLVIKVNNKKDYARLGGTAKTPHFCRALKFPPEEKETELIDIEESYGRTGANTPVGIVKPVELAMTNVSRVSLHNWDIVDYLGLHKGCHVVIRKAGEIIPEIVKCVETNRFKDDYEKDISLDIDLTDSINKLHSSMFFDWYKRPVFCKHCGTKLCKDSNRQGDSLVAWICPNPDCSVKNFKQIVKFVSKGAMNILGIGDALIENMLSIGIINDYGDLYSLTITDLLKLDGIKEKSATKIIESINKSKNNYLNQLLSGLGISDLGEVTAKSIANKFKTLQNIINASTYDLESIDGVGHELAESIVEWFKLDKNIKVINKLLANNVALQSHETTFLSSKLNGLSFIMTGTFDELSRDEFKKDVINNGGKIVSSITKSVNYVLKGENAGPSKIKKINELLSKGAKLKVIENISQFFDLIN